MVDWTVGRVIAEQILHDSMGWFRNALYNYNATDHVDMTSQMRIKIEFQVLSGNTHGHWGFILSLAQQVSAPDSAWPGYKRMLQLTTGMEAMLLANDRRMQDDYVATFMGSSVEMMRVITARFELF
ncbi:MAG: hypothetical protein M1828_005630 [Chrysothrix sp. TS-e1954]|nr:MAG: hypothetical protein M1828_005630 [Chrysothrix sp. TS-e1954]